MLRAASLDDRADLDTGEYLKDWLAHARGRVRPRTYQGYEGLIRLYAVPALGHVPLIGLRPLHLQGLYSRLP